MRLLLDTHIALWAIVNSDRLPTKARQLITDRANLVFVSAASVWEIAIKFALPARGVNDMPISGREAVDYFRESGFELLPIHPQHAAAVDDLPMLHRDPFDRLLVAQARIEPLRLLTHDLDVAGYGEPVLLV